MLKNIAILTLPLHTNYGGILQSVALYNFLVQNGKNVTLLDKKSYVSWKRRIGINILRSIPFQNIKGVRARHLRREIHRDFINSWLPSQTRCLRSPQEMQRAMQGGRFDAVVVGSDQVWRMAYVPRAEASDYFLGFVPDEIRKVSYAASFGETTWSVPELRDKVSKLLARFHRISVRETSGLEILKDSFGQTHAGVDLDPTLLMPASFYEAMAGGAQKKDRRKTPQSGKVLAKYVLDGGPELAQIEARVLAQMGAGARAEGIVLDAEQRTAASIPQWLRHFMDADFVLTDSFHGMAFSIIFRKQFFALVNRERGADRFTSLAKMLGLEDRLIFTSDQLQSLPQAPIDYDAVARRHQDLAKVSARNLLQSLS